MDAYLMKAYILAQQAIARLHRLARGAQPGSVVVEFMVLAAGLAVVALIIVQVVSLMAHESTTVIQNCFHNALTPVADATATTTPTTCH